MLEGEATPLEDLMQEHAVLERILLVYEEGSRRLVGGHELAPDVLTHAAGLVRRYIEDHHERDEELHIFPRLERVGVELELIQRLRLQHATGRALTSEVIELSTNLRDPARRTRVVESMQRFIRMYRPHAARENTVLFPAFRKAVSQPEYEALRDAVERSERAIYGDHLFETVLDEVHDLETTLGISELA
jgi:hemerythrin-like domain-containing protein